MLAIALVSLGAGCGSHRSASTSSPDPAAGVTYGSLPPVGTPTTGGTISVGQLAGSSPTYIFPIVPGVHATSYTINLIQNLFIPLYSSPTGAKPTINYRLSLARRPTFSDRDTTVTIRMNRGFTWSDGAPVDADDVLFEIDLLRAAVKESPANWNQYTPGQFPTGVVSATAPSKYELVIKLDHAYNPSYLLDNELILYPLPSTAWNIAKPGGPRLNYDNPRDAKRIYDFLAGQGEHTGTFATNPLWRIVDGPFTLHSFSAPDGSYVLAPNRSYHGRPAPRATIDVHTYPSIEAQLTALRSGSLDVAGLDLSQLNAVAGLRSHGYSVFGGPSFGWVGATINFEDQTGHFAQIIKQLYVRQALAHLVDQPAYVRDIFKTAGSTNYGPVPNVPANPYTPANNTTQAGPYPYSPSRTVALLKAHGWKVVPHGQTTCRSAGSGADQCGAGIPAGTPLRFNWVDLPPSQSPSSAAEGQAFAAAAKSAAGIDVTLETKTFGFQIASYDDAEPSAGGEENQWAIANDGGVFYDFYPTSSQIFDTHGVFNSGGFTDARADRLIQDSVHGGDPQAVRREGGYLTANLPVLFLPQSDNIYAVSGRVGGAPDGFTALTQQSLSPQYWYLNK